MKYRTIVADPPWPYKAFAKNKGGRYGDGTIGKSVISPLPYESMSISEIRSLPVLEMADKDCWLWLWTTNRYLRDAFDVMDSWGFKYGQTFIWYKTDGHPRYPATIAPNRAEYLLVGKRGKPRRIMPVASNVLEIPFNPRIYRHSQKPEQFQDLIETVCEGKYLELFARRQRVGWDVWGNEVNSTVEIEI